MISCLYALKTLVSSILLAGQRLPAIQFMNDNKRSTLFLSLFFDLLLLVLYFGNPLDKPLPPYMGWKIILVFLLITTLGFWFKRLYYILYAVAGLVFSAYYFLQ
ncbi:hypothetical protein [Spirosoma sp. KUDC1026]|uniref:hypothetical protein n=1 Tax=Spirosoma sp. KUDC1026 TaxID=2745947 RepID=UPI00159BB3FD|nr:hypothetical protein [Spirosoma sp. KUDC1026]QKZ14306.1 hypothetical protein HU175_17400 [Spirosoma sp. KUDC1026]